MRKFKIEVYFKKGRISQHEIKLIQNDYNSIEFDFEFDIEDGKKVFELKKPDGTVWIKDIVDNKIILVDYDDENNIIPVVDKSGSYNFEIVCYTENSKLTTEPGCFQALDEVVNIDEDELSENTKITLLDSLINETIEASKESKKQGDYAKSQGDYAKEQADSVISANSQATEIINEFKSDVDNYTTSFNENADNREKSYNDNHQTKMSDYNENTKLKTNEYNTNHTNKLKSYNDNDKDKTTAYNTNHDSKLESYNTNDTEKTNSYNQNHTSKMNTYNENHDIKMNEFNSEVDTLKDELSDCYNNQLIGQVSGTSVYVDDSADARIRAIEIDGNLEQETTKGINLIDLSNPTTTNLANGTFSFENDILDISAESGVYSSVTYNILELAKKNLGKSLAFYYESWLAESENKQANVSLQINYNDSTPNSFPTLVNNNGGRYTFHIPENIDNISVLRLRIFSNNTNTDLPSHLKITKPMLYFGTATDDVAYESYTGGQPSPNPDYPQEIEVLETENIFDGVIENGYYRTSDGITHTDDSRFIKSTNFTSVKCNQTYSFIAYSNKTRIKEGNILFYQDNGTYISYVSKISNSFTVPENATKVKFNLYDPNGLNLEDIDYTMLVEGINDKSYIPFGCIQTKVTNRNLLKNELTSKTLNGITATVNDDGSINFKGTITEMSTFELFKYAPDFLKKGVQYTLSSKCVLPPYVYFRFSDAKDTNIFYGLGNREGTYSSALTFVNTKNFENGIKCFVWFASNSIGNEIDFTLYPQLEEGNEETEYIPYQEDTVNIDLQGNFVGKINDEIKDTLRIENGHAILTKKVDKERLTSNNILSFADEYKRFSWINTNSSKSIGSEYIKSNFAICKTNTTVNAEHKNTIMLRERENGGHIIYLWLDNVTNIDEAKEFLDSNEMYVYYILKEPYDIDLGPIKLPKTFKDVSNIFLNANLETNFKVDYVKDTQLVINDLQSQINNINTLLSTTETSALLLDNLQSDLESEVI